MATQDGVAATVLACRYELGPIVGQGGMAVVYRAKDLRLDRQVAVKILRAELAGQPESRHRFEAEARAAARVEHPNVVAVYDSGEDGEIPFLVTECLSGRTLNDELADGPLSPERLRNVLREILAALQAAHAAGVIHRDIKPGNVLLGDHGHVKVSDFGIAKTLELADPTVTRDLLATPLYLAPERAAGEAASPRSDLYSVGVLAYEALTGRRPFQSRDPIAILEAIRFGAVTPAAQLRPNAPPQLVAVIENAMARDPDHRFQSAAAMLHALDHHTFDHDVLSRTSNPEVTVPVMANPPTLVLEAQPADQPRTPRQDAPRRPALVLILAGAVVALLVALAVLLALDDSPAGSPAPGTATIASTLPSTRAGPVGAGLPSSLEHSLEQLERSVGR